MLKFKKGTVTRVGRTLAPLEPVAGYVSGPWSIHADANNNDMYTLAVQGCVLARCFYLKSAKTAARQFLALPINWDLPLVELRSQIASNKELSLQCAKIQAAWRLAK
jgi:hypothetical protein